MTAVTPVVIYVDARPLQDPAYAVRGIGQHSISLLEALRRARWPEGRPRLVGVIDGASRPLAAEHERVFDRVTTRARPDRRPADARQGPGWFLSLSPVTHDPVRMRAFLMDDSLYRVALFYDLIPLQFPEVHLAAPGPRMNYFVALAWLRKFDAFAAISRFTADELVARMAVDPGRVFVSGVAVRPALEPAEGEALLSHAERACVVVSAGHDPRKNPRCTVIAHARSSLLREAGVGIGIFGGYPDHVLKELRRTYAEHGGRAQDLVFHSHLSDEELRQVYRHGLATVVPSYAEGFSIPIVESSAAGTPVIASDVGAHPELLPDAAWRFDPDDPERLQMLLERLLTDEPAWTGLRDAQAPLWRAYTAAEVGRRFVDGALALAPATVAAPAVRRGAKPSLAVLTPLPPAASGVADFSAAALRPLKGRVDLHMFTPTPNAHQEEGWASLQPVKAAGNLTRRFDATLSVIGNSHHHVEIFDFLMEHGGACLAHDARMVHFYTHLKSMDHAVQVAQRELKRLVSAAEINDWMHQQRNLQTPFLSELIQAADPFLVLSKPLAGIIKARYDHDAGVLPFAEQRNMPADFFTEGFRERSRNALGFSDGTTHVVTFGNVLSDRAAEDLIWSIDLLRQWGVDADLTFCGPTAPHMLDVLTKLAKSLGLEGRIKLLDEHVDEAKFVTYLAAADIAVQLRTHTLGSVSGALSDCILAGLPTVANTQLADVMEAPSYVERVPDVISSVLVAEAILSLIRRDLVSQRSSEIVQDFRRSHSPEAFCTSLMDHLGL